MPAVTLFGKKQSLQGTEGGSVLHLWNVFSRETEEDPGGKDTAMADSVHGKTSVYSQKKTALGLTAVSKIFLFLMTKEARDHKTIWTFNNVNKPFNVECTAGPYVPGRYGSVRRGWSMLSGPLRHQRIVLLFSIAGGFERSLMDGGGLVTRGCYLFCCVKWRRKKRSGWEDCDFYLWSAKKCFWAQHGEGEWERD